MRHARGFRPWALFWVAAFYDGHLVPAQPNNPITPPTEAQDPLSFEDSRDLAAIEAIRSGAPNAWNDLVRRYQDRLFTVCLRMVHNRDLAADLTQDAFVKIIQGLDSFDARSKFSTWAIRVTMNVCLSKLRSEKLRRHASLDAPITGGRPSGTGSGGAVGFSGDAGTFGETFAQGREQGGPTGVQRQDDRARVLAGLRLLDEDQRAILILRDAQGLEYDQIAEVLGVAVGTIKSRLFRARAALRSEIEKMGE